MVTSTLQTTLPYPPEQVWQVVTDLTDTCLLYTSRCV